MTSLNVGHKTLVTLKIDMKIDYNIILTPCTAEKFLYLVDSLDLIYLQSNIKKINFLKQRISFLDR